MKTFALKLFDRAENLAQAEPVLAFFVGGALLTLFLSAFHHTLRTAEGPPTLLLQLYRQGRALVWALTLVALTATVLSLLRGYLRQTLTAFQRTHGRITQANYQAVQTIWGSPQIQQDLRVEIYYDEEITERIELEDLTKPAILRKKIVRHSAPGNPFVAGRHAVTLRQNPRRKGSAIYGGYETACRFRWSLTNPVPRDFKCNLKFPFPAQGAMYDEMSATLNGADILAAMEIKEGALVLARDLKAGEFLDFQIGFKSRGMSAWYFQVMDEREIRDFTLTLTLPDLAKMKLNYPEGCMSPTYLQPTADGKGSVLTYRLDHAISNKGMGIALPKITQPGAATNAVLNEVERGWMLSFATLLLTFTLFNIPFPALITTLFAGGTALACGLMSTVSDMAFGFWGSAAIIFLPLFAIFALLLMRVLPGMVGKLVAAQLVLYGAIYPAVAGLDADRQSLYLNICALALLAFAAGQLVAREWIKPARSAGQLASNGIQCEA